MMALCLPERVVDGKYVRNQGAVSSGVLCSIVLYVFARYKLSNFETAVLGILLFFLFQPPPPFFKQDLITKH